ncbi:MAG TPA: hypothetical protein VJ828_12715 [Lacipirellulaceae bacterium]|nr:hypothetical protein [Lacipirellulaceae bacterium]
MPSVLDALRVSFVLLCMPCVALSVNPAQWLIVEQLNRGDTMKTWTSPTAIDLDKMVWEYSYEITKVTGTVNLGVFGDVTQDITSSIPEDDRTGMGESRNLPAVLLDEILSEPESGTSAHVFVEVDDFGFGQGVFSDIMLGSIDVPLFGSRPIQRINVEARVDIAGYDFGDYDRSGTVNADDYASWRSSFGQSGPDLPADGNGNGTVDAADYVLWRANFGPGAGAGPSIVGAVPEPATGMLLIAAILSGVIFGRTRRG